MALRLLLLASALLVFAGCKSRSVLSDAESVKVSRDAAGKDCKELGTIMGRTGSAKGTQEEALADLKQEAANKGANYVMVREYSSYGTSVTGVAYECN